MDEPRGPRAMAEALEAKIADLEHERTSASKTERRLINQRIHIMTDLLRWCRTRAGY